jgi:hypothetical protein
MTEKKASAWKNPHPQGTLKARNESLQEVVDAILLTARDRIIEAQEGRQYKATDEIRKAEHEIEGLQKEVMSGQANLSDFREATERWARICTTELESLTS